MSCDAAIGRDLLAGDELRECLDRAGDDASVHESAIEALAANADPGIYQVKLSAIL